MNTPLSQELIFMAQEDRALRSQLAADGSLFNRYHPLMKEVFPPLNDVLSVRLGVVAPGVEAGSPLIKQ